MQKICWLINNKTDYKTLSACCGHGRYPMTIIVDDKRGRILEYFSQIEIPRTRNFYKRDGDGFFYIQEVSKPKRLPTRRVRIKR